MSEDNRSNRPHKIHRDKDLEFDVFHVEGDISRLPGQRFPNQNRANTPNNQGITTQRGIQDQFDGPVLKNNIRDARIAQQEALAHTREIKNNPVIKKAVFDSRGPTSERVLTDAGSPEHIRIISDGSGPRLDRSVEDGDGPITNRELPNHGQIMDLLEETLRSQRDALKEIRAMRDGPGPTFIRISTDAVGPPRIRQTKDGQGPTTQAVRYAPGSGPTDRKAISSLPGPSIDKNLGTGDFAERIRVARAAQQSALNLLKSMQDATGPSDAREMLDVNLNMSRAREAQLRAMALLRNISDHPAPTDETAFSDAEGPAKLRALADRTEDTHTLKPHHINVDNKAHATQSEGLHIERRSSDSEGPEIIKNIRDAEGEARARHLSDASRTEKLRIPSDTAGPSDRREMSDAEGPPINKIHTDAHGPSDKRVIKDGIGPKFIRAIKDVFLSKAKKPQAKTEIKLDTHSISIAERIDKIREEQRKALEMLSDKKEK